MIFVGVDPGQNGGLVALNVFESGEPIDQAVVTFSSMPKTELEVWDWFANLRKLEYHPVTACIEKVSGYIGEEHPGSSMFNFGWGYGGLRMALVGNDIEFDEVAPRTWMAQLGIGTLKKRAGESKAKFKARWKHHLKGWAEKLYPRILTTLATSDALLIATYCRWKYEGRFTTNKVGRFGD